MNRWLSQAVAGATPIVLLLAAGCSHAAPQSRLPDAVDAIPATKLVSAPAPAPPPTTVHVADDLRTACKIDDSDVGTTPLFPFDSAALSQGDQRLLVLVARCVTAGPLQGRALSLVGRADPRGTDDYNMALGDRRAASVERYLHARGVDTDKLRESSRGARDATGHDEASWQKDRRVDVALAL